MGDAPPALLQLLQQVGQFPAAEAERLLTIWQHPFQLRRGEWLSAPERRDRYVYFVCEGALRIYSVGPDGEETCLGFSYPGSLTGSYPSLITGKPADIYVQALQDCQLLGALWSELVELTPQIPNIERFRRILAEETLLGRMEREIEMLTLPPSERYARVLARSPHLFQWIPQKYIASYLGMTPETLSRIRNRKG